MPSFTLVSFPLCPFVQRAAITLHEKGVPFTRLDIDLAAKPDWFLGLSPQGKVPLLVVRPDGETGAVERGEGMAGAVVLFESAAINEYLDEVTPGALLPADPLQRARQRAWIAFGSDLLVDLHGLALAADEPSVQRAAAATRAKLERLEAEVALPYFAGETLTLADTALAPALQRLRWLVELGPELALVQGLPKLATWTEALLARPAVQASAVATLREGYRAFLAGGGSPSRRVAPSLLGARV
jgi:glutathione S-transferase